MLMYRILAEKLEVMRRGGGRDPSLATEERVKKERERVEDQVSDKDD